ncbi:MAG: dTMP kinase, partial [Anaerolineae bacterium]|nr:dTMP kinase [Thermoflexales bacterium]MDW8408497.1 dTMP kinase [Anaerolineae bacterium]
MEKGILITFEGPEGSGKTSQLYEFSSWLLGAVGLEAIIFREPGSSQIGERVRAILMDRTIRGMNARTEALLFCAARAQMVAEQMMPRLLHNKDIVLCDRFTDSTLAYQGYGRGLDLDLLRPLLEFCTFGIKPDLTIYLD